MSEVATVKPLTNEELAKNQMVANSIRALNAQTESLVKEINDDEQRLNLKVAKLVRLRKNLYGILGAKQPETLVGLFEREDRLKLAGISRRYQSLQASDLVDSVQLAEARAAYQKEGEIEIDEDALVSEDHSEIGGFWVQAWVWLMPPP